MDNMKATDLRIGNIIYQGEKYGNTPITSYDLNKFYDKSIFFYTADFYEGFAPTPLNEEWLLRLGFKMHEGNNFYRYWINSDFELTYRPISEAIIFCFTPRRTDRMTGLEVKYVHQLQNLYFALTGEELILNGN